MSRRSIALAVLAAVSWAPRVSAHQDGPPPEAPRPNVLFVAVDDLNDWVGFLGGHPQVRTPHFDRLARRGVVFANAHCAAPLCCPSRAAVFSGRHPFRTGILENHHDLRKKRPDLALIPQHFKGNGYVTLGTGKLLHRRRPDLFDRHFFTEQRWSPFARQDVEYTPEELPTKGKKPRHVIPGSIPGSPRDPRRPPVVLPLNGMPSDRSPNDRKGESFDWGPLDVADGAMGDARVADWAAGHLRRESDRPFFLAVGFYRPHIPLFAPRKYFEGYPVESTTVPRVPPDDLDDLGETGRRRALEAVTAGLHETVVKYGEWKAAVAGYLACVSFVDAQVGKLLEALDSGPHAENTVVVLWSDHGWHLGEKRHWGKWTGWERSTRVPLVIVPAKADRGRFRTGEVSREPVSLLDLYPTLVDLCRLTPRAGLDGVSLVPLLRRPDAETRRTVITTFGAGNHTLRSRHWRYIRYADGSEELYDHRNDSREWRNLAEDPQHAAVRDDLRQRLAAKLE